MELSADLVCVQGILNSCLKRTGEFTKINFRGGNEEKIVLVVSELWKYLSSKNYLTNGKINTNCTNELNDITFFLALNTKFKKQLPFEEFSHLTGIIPPLSKCLFAHICYGLDLCSLYGNIICKFPLDFTPELLDEVVHCLKNSKPDEQLNNAFIMLKATGKKLSVVELSNETEEDIENVVAASNNILKNLTGIGVDYVEKMKKIAIYQHMGLTLLHLLDLLLFIDPNAASMERFSECLISTCCNIYSTVSVNVFCAWAEVKYDDQPLQLILTGRAYLVMKKYKKIKIAADLLTMLGPVAKKPQTLDELIDRADLTTIVKKVNEANSDQQKWFKALIKTQIFDNDTAFDCFEKWYHLCEETDFLSLLNQPVPKNKGRYKDIILKCASNLNFETLKRALTNHFWHMNFQFQEDTQDRLVTTFNKMGLKLNENDLKDLLLILFENASLFFRHLYLTTLNGSQISSQVFNLTIDIASINNIGLVSIIALLNENNPTDQTVNGYIKLFEAITSCGSFSWDSLVSEILIPQIQKYRNENALDTMRSCLQILKHFSLISLNSVTEQKIFQELLICSSENRWKSFLQFDGKKEEIITICVEYILQRINLQSNRQCFLPNTEEHLEDAFSNYYKELYLEETQPSLLRNILPNIGENVCSKENGDENFVSLIKILPCCVSPEWFIIFEELRNRQGFDLTLSLFTDITILLCDFAKSQNNQQTQNFSQLIHPLKYCVQNYGKLISKYLQQISMEDQIIVINKVIRILKHIPDSMKTTEGMSLINVLPENALKSVAQDKELVARIVLINDQILCKALAQRILKKS